MLSGFCGLGRGSSLIELWFFTLWIESMLEISQLLSISKISWFLFTGVNAESLENASCFFFRSWKGMPLWIWFWFIIIAARNFSFFILSWGFILFLNSFILDWSFSSPGLQIDWKLSKLLWFFLWRNLEVLIFNDWSNSPRQGRRAVWIKFEVD